MVKQRGAEHLGGDRYRVRRYVPDRGDGKPGQRQRVFRAPNQRAADRAKARELAALDGEIAKGVERAGSVAGLCDDYQALKARLGKWSPSTAARNAHILDVIRADLGHHPLDQLTARHVDSWYATLTERGLSAQTITHYSAVLRAVLRQGDRWDRVTPRAVTKATRPDVMPRQVTPPTAQVVDLLLKSATGQLRAALHVAALAGLRRGEIMGLRWSDFDGQVLTVNRTVLDLPSGEVFVKPPKSRRTRRFTVDATLLSELSAQRARHEGRFDADDWYVFPDVRKDSTGQTPMRPGWLSLAWHRHRVRHGARSVNLHHLRHWNASTLLDRGVPMPVVQARLGHASITTTGIYSHALVAGDQAAAGKLTEALEAER